MSNLYKCISTDFFSLSTKTLEAPSKRKKLEKYTRLAIIIKFTRNKSNNNKKIVTYLFHM